MDEINVGPLSGRPPTDPQGPLRRAPRYYAGETYGRFKLQNDDVSRHANGSIPGIHDKAARRIIRKAFSARVSRVERGIRKARAMKAQACSLADEEAKSTRWGRRLLALELALHQPAYVPDKKALRAMRAEKRKLARAEKR